MSPHEGRLDRDACLSRMEPLNALRVAVAAALGAADMGAVSAERVFAPALACFAANLDVGMAAAAEFRRRCDSNEDPLAEELAALALVLWRLLHTTCAAAAKGQIETHELFLAKPIAATAARLLADRLAEIAKPARRTAPDRAAVRRVVWSQAVADLRANAPTSKLVN